MGRSAQAARAARTRRRRTVIASAATAVLVVVAGLTLAGQRIPLPHRGVRVARRRGVRGLLLFGAGLASLSCTLPIFLVVIGASLTTSGGLAAVGVFAGYALGMAVVLTALAIGVALLRDGITRTLTRVLPHLRWLTGGLLMATSAYLLYYWGTALVTPTSRRAHDPLISLTDRASATIQSWASSRAGPWLLLTAAGIVALALLRGLWRWVRTDPTHDQSADAAETVRSRS